MPGSSFGNTFRIATFGESHGGAVGVVVDGITPNVSLHVNDIQKQLDRRKPGQSKIGTSRKESDTVEILSGIFEGKTTGTPMLMILFNHDADPNAYTDIKKLYRPGHADHTYLQKYTIRDWRGSGRASGRETAARVAAGAIAQKLLSAQGITVCAYTTRALGISCKTRDTSVIEQNSMRACDMHAAEEMQIQIEKLADQHDSAGGIVECCVSGVPVGLGEPVFDKLDADLAKAMLSIGSIKGIEFGLGFAAADLHGSQHNDQMNADGFVTNHAGGIIGGISNGNEIVFRVVVKPTSSIAQPQRTVSIDGVEQSIQTFGRHDVCICPRIVPVVEAMTALVLIDHHKRHHALHT